MANKTYILTKLLDGWRDAYENEEVITKYQQMLLIAYYLIGNS